MLKRFSLGLILLLTIGCGPFLGSEKPTGNNNNNNTGNTSEELEDNRHMAERPLRKDGALNIAVAPGGGLNAYASLYLAQQFAERTGKDIKDAFNIFWGLSGGTIAATLLMAEDAHLALEDFKIEAKTAFPDVIELGKQAFYNQDKIVPIANDSDGARRKAFAGALDDKIKVKQFDAQASNKFVLVASANKEPVCYADSSIKLPGSCKHTLPDGTSVIEGVINSSNFQVPKNMLMQLIQNYAASIRLGSIVSLFGGLESILPDSATLFKKQQAILQPTNERLTVVDGSFAGKNYLDGNSPLPLALDYALQFKTKDNAEHIIVVFDNGSASNAIFSNLDFRNSIGMNEDGYARVERNGVVVNVYLIKLSVSKNQFDAWAMDRSLQHWADTERLVDREIDGPRKNIFTRAVDAVRSSFIN